MRSKQPELYCAAIIPYVAAATGMALRIVARRKMKVRFVWEDYLSMVSFLIGTAFTIISLLKTRWGLGKPIKDVDMPFDEILHHFLLDLWADMWLYTFSVGLSKFVVLGLYWRMFSRSLVRQPIRILGGLSVCWLIARVGIIVFQCRPVHKFWDVEADGKCYIAPNVGIYALSIPHFLIELGILICPMFTIGNLHLPLKQKIAVAGMFTAGIFVCASALGTIVHTALLDVNAPDLTYDGVSDQIWAVCDVNIAHFASSLPLLRPVLFSIGFRLTTFTRSIGVSNNRITKSISDVLSRKDAETDSQHRLADEEQMSDGSGHHKRAASVTVVALQELGHYRVLEAQDGILVESEITVSGGS
ncbi:hypothetical protein BDV95DRAFT_601498 [Massariosphaeria phaeospora]|uniref:Rhodopsin domain-containing protein n=1 Tax=Massariosphaeria phaeospora TaxID=100035 RepID=A0A7C8MJH8_9PLEO|nr:hypothetical protein BDV95DRAFT_601498 [Massariosphaeria phaeospora]